MPTLLLLLNLQFFADGAENPTAEMISDTPPSEKTKTDASDNEQKPEKTFTQAELDDLINKRLERERKKFADYDTLKSKAEEYEAQLEAQRQAGLTDLEKANEQAKLFETQVQELSTQLETHRTKAQQRAIKSDFIQYANKYNIVDVEDALKLSDLSAVTVDDDYNVTGVEDVVKALAENKPYLVAKKQQMPIGQATNAGVGAVDKSADQLLEEARLKARKSGSVADRVAYAQLKKQLGK